MSISSTTAVNSHISKGKKARRDYYPLVNRGYGSRFSLKMAIQDKHCLVSTTCTMRTELENKKKLCQHIIYRRRGIQRNLKILEPEEARQLEIQSILG